LIQVQEKFQGNYTKKLAAYMEKPLFCSMGWKTQQRSVRDIYVQAQKLRAQKKKGKEKKKKEN